MAVTMLVEPDPGGHRFQAVAHVAEVARRDGPVLLATSVGVQERPEFAEYLADQDIAVHEVFTGHRPPTKAIAQHAAVMSCEQDVARVVVMDADQALKRWWFEAPRAFGLRRRPRIIFMLTRYPAKLRLTDRTGWKLRISKATLALFAMATRTLHRVAGFAGRDDMSPGWLVKRTRDPAVCLGHRRDRIALRDKHGLDQDRAIIGIFGGVSERKFPDLTWEAMQHAGLQADLLLAGGLSKGVAQWVENLEPSPNGQVILRPGFLPNQTLDELIAASDIAALIMTNNGPSGIMGKALAADVPIVTAGSEVRAREAGATGGGEAAEFTAESIGAALTRALARDPEQPFANEVPLATAEEFSATLLGVPFKRP